MVRFAIALVLNCIVFSDVRAETAQELYVMCDGITLESNGSVSLPKTMEAGRCYGFFEAMVRSFSLVDANGVPSLRRCIPQNFTAYQLIEIFRQKVESHPRDANQDSYFFALNSGAKQFKCEQNEV